MNFEGFNFYLVDRIRNLLLLLLMLFHTKRHTAPVRSDVADILAKLLTHLSQNDINLFY